MWYHKNYYSWTTLFIAAMHRQPKFVIELASRIRDGNQLKKWDKFGRTTLHYVAKAGTKRATKTLVERDKKMTQVVDNN